ncbi:MAG TPA: TraB/GumN family protein [Hanamia sp.]|nr:TraB/GumN family protein [Hanamia sp.]
MKSPKYKNSLLYKISGNGLKKPSYLLGTMHIICAKDFYLHEKALRALDKCSIYYMEVDLGSAQQLQVMEQQASGVPDIYEGLSVSQKENLDHILQNQFGLSLDEAKQLPPVTLINRMAISAINCDDIRMVEMELLKVAQAKGLQTAGLETALRQLSIAQKVFTGKEILWQLKSANAYKELFAKMVKAYHSENLQELAMLVTDKRFMTKRAYNILVINRNKRWAKAIPSLIASQSAFIAVGAGHLPGEQGVLQFLNEQGYIVNPVYR